MQRPPRSLRIVARGAAAACVATFLVIAASGTADALARVERDAATGLGDSHVSTSDVADEIAQGDLHIVKPLRVRTLSPLLLAALALVLGAARVGRQAISRRRDRRAWIRTRVIAGLTGPRAPPRPAPFAI